MKHRTNMKFLKSLLISSIIFLYALYAVYGLKNAQLPNYIIPKHYNIHLNQESPDSDFFSGTCQILIKVDLPLNYIYLHAQKPQINIYSFLLVDVYTLNSTLYEPNFYTYDNESHIFNLYFTNKLSTHKSYILEVKFSTFLNGKGLTKSSYISEDGRNM